jgi:hypothetical protein
VGPLSRPQQDGRYVPHSDSELGEPLAGGWQGQDFTALYYLARYRGGLRSADEIDDLLTSAAKFQADGTTNKEFLDRLAKGLDQELKSQEKTAAPDYFLLAQHLAGENRYLQSFTKLPEHESMRVRIGLARLLGQVKDEPSSASRTNHGSYS